MHRTETHRKRQRTKHPDLPWFPSHSQWHTHANTHVQKNMKSQAHICSMRRNRTPYWWWWQLLAHVRWFVSWWGACGSGDIFFFIFFFFAFSFFFMPTLPRSSIGTIITLKIFRDKIEKSSSLHYLPLQLLEITISKCDFIIYYLLNLENQIFTKPPELKLLEELRIKLSFHRGQKKWMKTKHEGSYWETAATRETSDERKICINKEKFVAAYQKCYVDTHINASVS